MQRHIVIGLACLVMSIGVFIKAGIQVYQIGHRDGVTTGEKRGRVDGFKLARFGLNGFGTDTPDGRWHFTLSITSDVDEPKNTTVRFKFEPLTDEAREIEERLAAEEAKKGE